MSHATPAAARPSLLRALPDLLAFGIGLSVAAYYGWQTTDLVWSLWLASLVIGAAMLLWSITRPLRQALAGTLGVPAWRDRAKPLPVLVAYAVATFIGIAFFSVHFGGFHYVHSVFLNLFFPVLPGAGDGHAFPGFDLFVHVLTHYWMWLPAAFLAERDGFVAPVIASGSADAGANPLGKRMEAESNALFRPYRNVIRLHILIFVFAGFDAAGLQGWPVFLVVYATYFFPWRFFRRPGAKPAA